jgi:signal transduction histidine kinase/CheY-like chemotaxis protein
MGTPSAVSGRPLPLRFHLLSLVIGIVLPTLIVSGLLVRRVVNDNRASVDRQLTDAASAQAAMVDRELQGAVRALQGLSESDRVTSGEPSAFRDQAIRTLRDQPAWYALELSKPDGEQVMSTAAEPVFPSPGASDGDSVQRVVASRQPVIGNVRFGEAIKQYAFPVRVPVIRAGQVVYVLSAFVTSKGFSDVLRRDSPLPDEWVRGIVDTQGVVVARSRDPERYVGKKGTPAFIERYTTSNEGAYRDVALDGTAVQGAFSRAPYSHWIGGVAVPAAIVDRDFNQSMAALALLGVALLGTGGLGAFVISRRIGRDMSGLARAADALARGESPQMPSPVVAEVRQVADALDRSAVLLAIHDREQNEHIERVDAARRQAESSDRAKDDFLAMLGHELRNPLAPALTALQLLRQRHRDVAPRELDIIQRQIQHMARLVDDLLDVSRLRRGVIALRRETFDLAHAIDRAVEMTTHLFNERGHELTVLVPDGIAIEGDPVRISQVFANLLTNAAKYTPPGGHVSLTAKSDAGYVVIQCRDDGMGMASELVPRVFELFVQGERGVDRREGGLGIGLPLARALVERHGGTIEAASPGPEMGSTFTVRLRLAPVGALLSSAGLSGRRRDAAVKAARVLVVEDNRDGLEMVVAALRDAGFDVMGAPDGVEALAIATRFQPHIALLDIGLPSIDGYRLARMLRRAGATIHLVALTGYGQDQDAAAARDAGFEVFLVKPVSIEALMDALNGLLAVSSSR